MPWLPELFSAPALARIEERHRRERLVLIPFFLGLMTGEIGAIIDYADNISRGRLVVGLGRGTAYNIYDYQGYGIDPKEAYDRLVEAEEIVEVGEQVVAVERHSARGLKGSEAEGMVGHSFACLFTFREGKVSRVKEYATREDALEAVGLSE